MSKISCHNVHFELNGQRLLEAVDAEFFSGQVNVVLGQNGAGKSTLLQIIAKSKHLDKSIPAGKVVWHQQDLASLSLGELALQRAVVEQSQNLQFDFSVRQFVSLGLEVQFGSELLEAYNRPVAFAKVLDQVLRTCDLSSFSERSVLSLSGGEMKRAQIARAIAQIWPVEQTQAELDFTGRWLFLDEWNAALDIAHQQCFAALLRTWTQQGLGVIMVVHDLPLAMQLADSVVLLKAGKLFAQGSAQAVFTREILEQGMQMQLQSVITETGQTVYLPSF